MATDYTKELEAIYGTVRAPTKSMQSYIGTLVGAAPSKSLRSKTLGRVLGSTTAGKLSFAGSQYEPQGAMADRVRALSDQAEVAKAKKKDIKNSARILGSAVDPFQYKPTTSVSGEGYVVI